MRLPISTGGAGEPTTTAPDGSSATPIIISGIGLATQSHNRIQAALAHTTYAAATNSFTWPAANNIREITITVSGTGAPVVGEDYVLFCFNAGNAAIAEAWVTEASSITNDAQNEKVMVGETKTFWFTSALTRLDGLAYDISGASTAAHVHIGAH